MKINLNNIAKLVTLEEGGKVNLPIGQVKEVMKVFLNKLRNMTLDEITELLKRK